MPWAVGLGIGSILRRLQMSEPITPIEATVIRSWNESIVTAYWEEQPKNGQPSWLTIRHIRLREGREPIEKTIHLSPEEVTILMGVIGRNRKSGGTLK
jgi:hypothetical protein